MFDLSKEMLKRPNCESCNKEESGIVIAFGKVLCGKCVIAIVEELKNKQNEFVEGIIKGVQNESVSKVSRENSE